MYIGRCILGASLVSLSFANFYIRVGRSLFKANCRHYNIKANSLILHWEQEQLVVSYLFMFCSVRCFRVHLVGTFCGLHDIKPPIVDHCTLSMGKFWVMLKGELCVSQKLGTPRGG